MQHHNYALSDIENLMPWERDIYLIKIEQQLKEEKRQAEEAKLRR